MTLSHLIHHPDRNPDMGFLMEPFVTRISSYAATPDFLINPGDVSDVVIITTPQTKSLLLSNVIWPKITFVVQYLSL